MLLIFTFAVSRSDKQLQGAAKNKLGYGKAFHLICTN